MNRIEINNSLEKIFKKVFKNESIVLRDELTANDIDNWDSLTHMVLISDIEQYFSIKFKLKEMNKMRNVGDMIDIISTKI